METGDERGRADSVTEIPFPGAMPQPVARSIAIYLFVHDRRSHHQFYVHDITVAPFFCAYGCVQTVWDS